MPAMDSIKTTPTPREISPQSPTKRKACIAGLPVNGLRPVKRRAAKACQTCRSRKVRCDVVDSGPPCNNCRLDQIQCVVSDSRRKRKPRCNEVDEQSPASSAAEVDVGDSKSPRGDDALNTISSSEYTDELQLNPSPGNSFDLELDHHVPHMLYRTQGHRLSQEERTRRISLTSSQSTERASLGGESNGGSKRTPSSPSCGSARNLVTTRMKYGNRHTDQDRSCPHQASGSFSQPHTRPLMAEDINYLQTNVSILIHLLAANSDHEVQRKANERGYLQCTEVLQQLRSIYRAADHATSCLQAAMQRAGVPQTSMVKVEEAKVISGAVVGAVLTPPPETCLSEFLGHSSLSSEQFDLCEEQSPLGSDEQEGSASSGRTAHPDDMDSTTFSGNGLDNEFDVLFNLDLDLGLLAAEDEEGKSSSINNDAKDLYHGHELEPLSDVKTAEELHRDPILGFISV